MPINCSVHNPGRQLWVTHFLGSVNSNAHKCACRFKVNIYNEKKTCSPAYLFKFWRRIYEPHFNSCIHYFYATFQPLTDFICVCAPLATIPTSGHGNSLDASCNKSNIKMTSHPSHLENNVVWCLQVMGEWKSSDASIAIKHMFIFSDILCLASECVWVLLL